MNVKANNLFLIIPLLFLISCGPDPCYTKTQFIDSCTAFFEEFKSEHKELSEKEIEIYEARYNDLLENCYKKYKVELTPKERKAFWKSSISFYIEKEGGLFNIDFDNHKDEPFKKYMVEEIEELADSTSQDFAEIIESILEDELPRLIDSFVGKIEELGNEIKASIKEE